MCDVSSFVNFINLLEVFCRRDTLVLKDPRGQKETGYVYAAMPYCNPTSSPFSFSFFFLFFFFFSLHNERIMPA